MNHILQIYVNGFVVLNFSLLVSPPEINYDALKSPILKKVWFQPNHTKTTMKISSSSDILEQNKNMFGEWKAKWYHSGGITLATKIFLSSNL